jgi:Domain of unknown function (DUF1918)
MNAKHGDELVVDSVHTGEPSRCGEILEVLETDGVQHFRVRWDDDGHEAIFYPGSTTHVVQLRSRR